MVALAFENQAIEDTQDRPFLKSSILCTVLQSLHRAVVQLVLNLSYEINIESGMV